MNTNIFALCGCAIIACILITTVKQHRPDIAVVLTCTAGIILFAYIITDLITAIKQISALSDTLGSYSSHAGIIIRSLGVCLTIQLSADICRDSGLATAASRIETGGRIAVLLMIMPILTEILEICKNIIQL